ncbi:hypothetical protein B0H19DRAFT_1163156 [Mycena capillaripes]|nr:hypothetical protein B0H19DRAFT_1163156 [Mycena capillaripes]
MPLNPPAYLSFSLILYFPPTSSASSASRLFTLLLAPQASLFFLRVQLSLHIYFAGDVLTFFVSRFYFFVFHNISPSPDPSLSPAFHVPLLHVICWLSALISLVIFSLYADDSIFSVPVTEEDGLPSFVCVFWENHASLHLATKPKQFRGHVYLLLALPIEKYEGCGSDRLSKKRLSARELLCPSGRLSSPPRPFLSSYLMTSSGKRAALEAARSFLQHVSSLQCHLSLMCLCSNINTSLSSIPNFYLTSSRLEYPSFNNPPLYTAAWCRRYPRQPALS